MKKRIRKSHTSLGKIYFWTATIHQWIPLIAENSLKEIIIGSLKFLSDKMKITVYGFVIMPNHIHLIWRQNNLNGKETPKGSFMKYTAHRFQEYPPPRSAPPRSVSPPTENKILVGEDTGHGIKYWSVKTPAMG